jgi:hypothetical protein
MIYHIKDLINPYYQECIKSDIKLFKNNWGNVKQTILKYEEYYKEYNMSYPDIRDHGQDELTLIDNNHGVPPENTNLFFFIKPIILAVAHNLKLKITNIERAKFNKLYQDEEFSGYNIPHTDTEKPNGFSFVYYVQDSDGDTVFFDGDKIIARITPKQGEIVAFSSNVIHASCNPKETAERIVLNVVMEIEQ